MANAFPAHWAGKAATLATLACIPLLPIPSSASVVGSRHDLSTGMGSGYPHGAPFVYNEYGQVCVYCHTPHSASTDNGGALLWNRPFSTATYILYASPTAKLTPGQPSASTSSSALCLSCHDGTIAVDTVVNPPNQAYVTATNHRRMNKAVAADSCGGCHDASGASAPTSVRAAFFGTDLSMQHPVNMLYDNLVNTGLADATAVQTAGLKLFGGKVQCASCHDPHITTYGAFLRKLNTGSALCFTCHNK